MSAGILQWEFVSMKGTRMEIHWFSDAQIDEVLEAIETDYRKLPEWVYALSAAGAEELFENLYLARINAPGKEGYSRDIEKAEEYYFNSTQIGPSNVPME